jgi:hypothetical protein
MLQFKKTYRQCCGFVILFLYGSRFRSADPCHLLTDPDSNPVPDLDPAFPVSGCMIKCQQKQVFQKNSHYLLNIHLHQLNSKSERGHKIIEIKVLFFLLEGSRSRSRSGSVQNNDGPGGPKTLLSKAFKAGIQ